MNDFRADLHCHSTCSDGTLTPTEIVQLAAKIGLKGLSITDHDGIDAYQEAIPFAQSLDIQLLHGVELSTVHQGTSIHILGYAFDLTNEALKKFCIKHKERRNKRNRAIIDRLRGCGIEITYENVIHSLLHKNHSIGRPHIAQVLVDKGYVKSINEAFTKYLADGKSCYVPGHAFTTEESIAIIHEAKGLAVIAHPYLIKKRRIIQQLLEMPFDGIECYYGRIPSHEESKWLKIAEEKNWIITGGSDFHGTVKPTIPLGVSWVDEGRFNILFQHQLEHSTS